MTAIHFYDDLTARLRASGDHVWPLFLRLILAWEFWESGITKLNGENWFADIPWADWQKGFPFPFDRLSVDLNWTLATWGELGFAVLLVLGLFTRFAAFALIVVTAVATAAVHWPAHWDNLGQLWDGYVITPDGAGNFKLPLLFMVMLLPLVFYGAGKFSLDRLLLIMSDRAGRVNERTAGLQSAALALLVLALTVVWLEPLWGLPLFAAAVLTSVTSGLTGRP